MAMGIALDKLGYVDVIIPHMQEESASEFVAVVFSRVHGFNMNSTSEDRLGIDLPEWGAESTFKSIPKHLRLFGAIETLREFLAQPQQGRLRAVGISFSKPATVKSTDQFATVFRDCKASKGQPAHLRRLARRGHSVEKIARHRPGFSVQSTSKSTGERFYLALSKKPMPAEQTISFTNYGTTLSGALPQF